MAPERLQFAKNSLTIFWAGNFSLPGQGILAVGAGNSSAGTGIGHLVLHCVHIDVQAGKDMNLIVQIPGDVAQRLIAAGGDLSRRALEALALEEYKLGKHELRRLLGFGTRDALDGFLKTHDVFEPYSLDDLERERRDLRLGF